MKESVTLAEMQDELGPYGISWQLIHTVIQDLVNGVTQDYDEKLKIIFDSIEKSRIRSRIIALEIDGLLKLNLTDEQMYIVLGSVYDSPALITYIPKMLKLPIMTKKFEPGSLMEFGIEEFKKQAPKFINGERVFDTGTISYTVKL